MLLLWADGLCCKNSCYELHADLRHVRRILDDNRWETTHTYLLQLSYA